MQRHVLTKLLRRPSANQKHLASLLQSFLSTKALRPSLCHSTRILQHTQSFSRSFSSKDESHTDFQIKHHSDNTDDIQQTIQKHIQTHPILLYMKGTPTAPQCGFSLQVVRMLHAQGVDFDSINVLAHPEIREGIKSYSNWPTIPQLYVNGEFVGGFDIVTEMFKSGELEQILKEFRTEA